MGFLPIILIAIIGILICILLFVLINKKRKVQSVLLELKNQAKTLSTLWKIEQIIVNTLDFQEVAQKISDAVLLELGKFGFAIIVLSMVDEKHQMLRRISISRTDEAALALKITPIPFHEINIPLSAAENLCVRALTEKKHFVTRHLADMLTPVIQKDFVEKAQTSLGVITSIVFPITSKNRNLGSLIFSIKKEEQSISAYEWEMMRGYVDAVGIALENSLLYSDLKRISEELKQANIKLQELDKLKDEFVSLASHELRAPMTTIKGSISTILEGYAGEISEKTKEFLSSAYNENDRLIRLVNNLLNISRIEAGRLIFNVTKIDMEKLILDVVKNMQAAASDRNIFLKYEKQSAMPQVFGDEDKVKEVLINLVGNATKFTHKGGITVKTKVKDNMLVTSVTDTGSGIAAEDIDRLFKKFSQVSRDYARPAGGTGLGLYISKQIIEGLKGSVWLESVLGTGTTFYFSLPIVG